MSHASKTTIVQFVLLLLLTVSGPGLAHAKPFIRFDEAKLYIEINATDGDVGLQLKVDGEGWTHAKVFTPFGRKVLDIRAKGGIAKQGLTELFFESAEPSFDEQPLEEFLERFPEGYYWIIGRTTDRVTIIGWAELTHVLPNAPELLSPEEDTSQDPDNVVVSWEPVDDPEDSEIIRYQVVVEQEEPLRVFSADVTPDTTSISIPPEFMLEGEDYKYEVIAVEASGNQVISEAEFETME